MKNLLVQNGKLDNKGLLDLQKLYREGRIEAKALSEEEFKGLKKLYQEQIDFLEKSIETDRQKILKIKNQL